LAQIDNYLFFLYPFLALPLNQPFRKTVPFPAAYKSHSLDLFRYISKDRYPSFIPLSQALLILVELFAAGTELDHPFLFVVPSVRELNPLMLGITHSLSSVRGGIAPGTCISFV
jgi:hypothetical protein